MLVLSRCPGEEIIIADTIRIKVIVTSRKRVRLGISAPPNVAIDRLEIHERRTASAGAEHATELIAPR